MPKELILHNAYGRVAVIPEADWAEWLDDVPDLMEEIMYQPLYVAHPLAFYAPEMIRTKAIKLAIQGETN